jgi:hypothetical protein
MSRSIRIIWTFASVKGMMGIVVGDLVGRITAVGSSFEKLADGG